MAAGEFANAAKNTRDAEVGIEPMLSVLKAKLSFMSRPHELSNSLSSITTS